MSLRPKVFCIGWHKTGTSSLGLALIELGYTVVGARLDLEGDLRNAELSKVIEVAGQYDACQDVPWAVIFKELDNAYPGSKFVFTDRDEEAWLHSAKNHFKDIDISMHEWIYGRGRCVGNEEIYLQRFRQHRREVKEWFADRPQDLLELNLENCDGWAQLCPFLGHPIPNKAWPHANKGRHSLNEWERLIRFARMIVPISLRRRIYSLRLFAGRKMGYTDPKDRFNNLAENRLARRDSNKSR